MNDDTALLSRYAESGSEAAFAELVGRYVDLVYGAALRRTGGDPHRAAEVAQLVFTSLAREARKLSRHAILAAWLHTATRNAALNLMISEQRRQVRETKALAFATIAADGAPDPEWDRLRPLLDAAIDELPEADRAAVVLRFLERRPFAEIGAALRLSEDAARMRTDRALDKLRAALARQGIRSTATALGAVVLGQPLIAAPAGLAAAMVSQSIVAAGGGFFSVTFASLMTTKILVTASLSAALAFGAGTYFGFHRGDATTAAAAATASGQSKAMASLRQNNEQLSAEIDGLNGDLAKLKTANADLAARQAKMIAAHRSPNIGVPNYEMENAVMNNLRQIEAARKQYQLEHGHPAGSLSELVGIHGYIKAVRTVGGEDYSELPMDGEQPLTVMTPDGVSVTFDPSGTATTQIEVPPAVKRVQEMAQRVEPSAMKALTAYRQAHNGSNPPNEEAVLPYFSTPQEGADYAEFMEARRESQK